MEQLEHASGWPFHRPVHFYIQRGYVASPEEWPHSSWPRFAEVDPSSEAGLAMQRFPAPRQLPHDP